MLKMTLTEESFFRAATGADVKAVQECLEGRESTISAAMLNFTKTAVDELWARSQATKSGYAAISDMIETKIKETDDQDAGAIYCLPSPNPNPKSVNYLLTYQP